MTTFSGNFALFFFKIFLTEISQSCSGISQFLFQPNACKNVFSFEVSTVAGSHSFLRKVGQRSAIQRKFPFTPIVPRTDSSLGTRGRARTHTHTHTHTHASALLRASRLYMFFTCEELTPSKSAVDFGFSFGLIL